MNIAIAWYGAEGEASYKYYLERGHNVTIVTPQLSPQFAIPQDTKVITGDDVFDHLDGYDLVVRSASVRPDSLHTDGKIWSATNEFFAQCPAPIIGVTGTKGKGTTCSLITSVLRAAGYTVHLVGNIGLPALAVLPEIEADHIVVYELSSFQLWDLERSPQVAVVLMIEPDHLDVHRDMVEYVGSKVHIVKHQKPDDICVYHPTNALSRQIAEQSAGIKIRYATPDDDGVYIKSNTFFVREEMICDTSVLQLPGSHNLDNACAALTACLQFTRDYDRMQVGLGEFQGLPHRLRFVREFAGVRYYDDSIATTPGSAIAALGSFDGASIIILGGSDKGASYDEVIAECKRTKARVIAVGTTGDQIAALCEQYGVAHVKIKGRMNEAVEVAAGLAHPGETVILSPASASLDQYKSYAARGDEFIRAVQALER